ncbi:O-antigen ligase [Agrococcus baldri]|uniref:O-antigen ligase n=1 Tax=Agrococcus baldri TaxID=153730 RepID=A0AA94KYN7_9MICO|nr:O-antigen ligase family protein [Agrococcus baldri]SFS00313.1 O-antigen ligase [Agrococcus baldri]
MARYRERVQTDSPTRRDYAVAFTVVLLIHANLFKSSPLLAWLPIDLTLILAAVVAVLLLAHALRYRGKLRLDLRAVALLAIVLPAWLYGEFHDYWVAKLTGFVITLVALLAGFYLINTPGRRKAWLHAIVITAAVTLALTVIAPAADDVIRLSVAGATTISTGRIAGAALVILAVLATRSFGRAWIPMILLAAACGALMIATGSRGPVIAAAITILGVAIVSKGRGRFMRVILAVGALAAGLAFIQDSNNLGASRIGQTLTGEREASDARVELALAALRQLENPFGVGWANFQSVLGPAEMLQSGNFQYAHNVLLEVAVEAGWFPLIGVAVFLAWSLLRARGLSSTPHGAAMFGLLAFTVVNAMVSGDINDNRLMWATAAVILATPLPAVAPADEYRPVEGEPRRRVTR